MNGLRSTPISPGAVGAGATVPLPRGYDRLEFSPAECSRDFPRPRRPHVRDEERAMLRRVAAEMSADSPDRGVAPGGADAAEPPPGDGRSRLYRD